jgi:hypothetical protein
MVLLVYGQFLDEVQGHGFIWITGVSSAESWIQNAQVSMHLILE